MVEPHLDAIDATLTSLQDTWDSYVGGAGVGPTDPMFNFNMDLSNPLLVGNEFGPQDMDGKQPDGQTNGVTNGGGMGGPFMGVSTPPKNTLI